MKFNLTYVSRAFKNLLRNQLFMTINYSKKWTPLDTAASLGHVKIIEILLPLIKNSIPKNDSIGLEIIGECNQLPLRTFVPSIVVRKLEDHRWPEPSDEPRKDGPLSHLLSRLRTWDPMPGDVTFSKKWALPTAAAQGHENSIRHQAPIALAAKFGHLEALKMLLGLNTNSKSKKSCMLRTSVIDFAMYFAMAFGQHHIVEYLTSERIQVSTIG